MPVQTRSMLNKSSPNQSTKSGKAIVKATGNVTGNMTVKATVKAIIPVFIPEKEPEIYVSDMGITLLSEDEVRTSQRLGVIERQLRNGSGWATCIQINGDLNDKYVKSVKHNINTIVDCKKIRKLYVVSPEGYFWYYSDPSSYFDFSEWILLPIPQTKLELIKIFNQY